jgi:glycosyltransferase involved in cell wall biosynthesis
MNSPNADFQTFLSRRPKVVIGHPFLGRGGSEARVMWLVEALKPDCDVTVMTTGGWHLNDLNRSYGTSVKSGEVSVRLAPVPPLPARAMAAALRGALYQRFARRIAPEYDVRISAYNPTDWGMPAVHFIADFSWHREIREAYDPQTPGFVYRNTPLRRAYLSLVRRCGSPSDRNPVLDDRLIANSDWSAAQLRRYYPLPVVPVIYPPVWASFPLVPWSQKEIGFVMIGRIAPEKRIQAVIRVLDNLRSRGHRLTLHLCGGIPRDTYGRMIADLCAANREWVFSHGHVSGSLKAGILARCRYGIQMCPCEAFGISVAEMVRAGAIVFAPNDGGQTEILKSPDLLFDSEAGAIEKIQAVLEEPELQASLRTHLASRAEMFSAERFMREARAYIAEILIADRGAICAFTGQRS